MKHVLSICLAIAILGGPTALAQDRPPVAEAALTRVGVRLWISRTITSTRIIESLKAEAEGIWAPYGIQLAWLDKSVSPQGLWVDVTIEREWDSPDRTDWSSVLGSVMIAKDDPAPYPIHVSFDATREMLLRRAGAGRIPIPGVVPEGELARALGRVIAHEIGHVLIGTSYHDRSGLMRATFSPDLLGAPDRSPFRLTCNTVRQLRNGRGFATGGAACS